MRSELPHPYYRHPDAPGEAMMESIRLYLKPLKLLVKEAARLVTRLHVFQPVKSNNQNST